jgi:D-alanine-D-alanine ligase
VKRPLVAVAKGGTSFEREVSLRGAHRVSAALKSAGYDVAEVEIDHSILERLRELTPRFVFIVAHGRHGEDGALQSLLELLGLPFTGSDSLTSSLCIDKILTKRILHREGLPTPEFHAFSRGAFEDLGAAMVFDEVLEQFGMPMVVKPARTGSSFGIKLVSDPVQLRPAILGAVAYDDEILVERHIAGREFAVTVMGPAASPHALPIVEIVTTRELYDYEAHYDFDVVKLDAPAQLPADTCRRIEEVAIDAYRVLGCRDFARVDLILDHDNQPQILELNTIPGLTETGPTPFAADAAGMSFTDLILAIAERVAATPIGLSPPRP